MPFLSIVHDFIQFLQQPNESNQTVVQGYSFPNSFVLPAVSIGQTNYSVLLLAAIFLRSAPKTTRLAIIDPAFWFTCFKNDSFLSTIGDYLFHVINDKC